MFKRHYHESLPLPLSRLFAKRGVRGLKTDLRRAFERSKLLEITEHDCSAIPRILPLSYLATIKRSCFDITTMLMKILSLPDKEMRDMIPPTPITRYLIGELGVLKHRPKRLTGTIRFDMAIEGPAMRGNPPKLLEVNEIGFDGVGRSSFIQETILKLFPELRRHVVCLDTAAAEVKNMRRLGKRLVRIQYGLYNWEEEVVLMKAKRAGLKIDLVCPDVFDTGIEPKCKLLKQVPLKNAGPGPFMVAYSFELSDYKEAPAFFKKLVRSEAPQYSPFVTGLIAPKTVLTVLANDAIRSELIGRKRSREVGRAILPAWMLQDSADMVKRRSEDFVLKRGDGMGGEHVYIGKDAAIMLRKIPAAKRREWIVQKRVDLNTIEVDGFLSRRRKVVADLSAYVQYDWDGKKFTNFSVGGFITRATAKGLKVNVSGGGIQVPVMFDRSR